MTAKTKILQRLQIGKQTAFITAVAPTIEMSLVDTEFSLISTRVVQEYTQGGNQSPSIDQQVLEVGAIGNLGAFPITYQDLPIDLDMLFDEATPSGTTPNFARTYTAPATGSVPSKVIGTLVLGDASGQVYAVVGAVLNTWTLNIEKGGDWKVTRDYIGSYMDTDALAAISPQPITPIRSADTTIYIDDFGDPIGITAVGCQIFSATLTISAQALTFVGIGSLNQCEEAQLRYTASLVLSMRFGPTTPAGQTAKDIVEDILGTSPEIGDVEKLIRLKAQPTVLSGDDNNIAQLDFAGVMSSDPSLYDDTDGVATVELTFTSKTEDASGGTFNEWFKASITNDVADGAMWTP